MGADAKAVDAYAKMFGVSPDAVRASLASGQAPGDQGFATAVLPKPAPIMIPQDLGDVDAPRDLGEIDAPARAAAAPRPTQLVDDAGNPVQLGAASPVAAVPPAYVPVRNLHPGVPDLDYTKVPVGVAGGDLRPGTPTPGTTEGESVPVTAAPKTAAEARAAAATWGDSTDADAAAKGVALGNKYAKSPPGGATDAGADAGITWPRMAGTATVPAHEQPLATPARQAALTGSIDAEGKAVEGQKDAATAAADANAEIERQRAIGTRDVAKAMEDAGVDTRLRAQAQADESKAYRKHIDDFSAKVASDKINPNRMWNDSSTGQKITWTIASALGAVSQAFLHLPTNQIADRIETMVSQDIAAQRANHEIGRERVADMNSMYIHALHSTNSAEEAERVATGYALEAAKQNAVALTQNASTEAQKAKGQEVVSALAERQAQIGEKKAEVEIKLNPLVQAHTVATGPDMSKVYASAREYAKEQAALGTVVPPDAAIRWAYKMHTGQDPLPGTGRFAGGAKLEGANKDLYETQIAADEFNKQVGDLRNHPVITGSGLGTELGAHLPQRLAPDSNDAQQQLNAINTRMLQAIGKVAKDADGKPNKAMIDKIEQRFEIHLGDKPEIKQQKLQGIADVYNSLAREQGARAPVPTPGVPPGFKP